MAVKEGREGEVLHRRDEARAQGGIEKGEQREGKMELEAVARAQPVVLYPAPDDFLLRGEQRVGRAGHAYQAEGGKGEEEREEGEGRKGGAERQVEGEEGRGREEGRKGGVERQVEGGREEGEGKDGDKEGKEGKAGEEKVGQAEQREGEEKGGRDGEKDRDGGVLAVGQRARDAFRARHERGLDFQREMERIERQLEAYERARQAREDVRDRAQMERNEPPRGPRAMRREMLGDQEEPQRERERWRLEREQMIAHMRAREEEERRRRARLRAEEERIMRELEGANGGFPRRDNNNNNVNPGYRYHPFF
uniref:Uncharacterized protein n=1 Tax=Palpitomonas bilix TaxID=652834 RepID=A0A7S3DGU1_9EUKA